jgi:hypothetical protein
MSNTAGVAAGLPAGPLFYYRPTHNDHRFLEDFPQRSQFDAAIIPARYLGPFAPGSRSALRGHDPRALATALAAARAPFVVDPDTPVLAALAPGVSPPTPRVPLMAHAQVASLPISPLSLAQSGARTAFVQASVTAQAGAAAIAAPYFEFDQLNGSWHRRNLDLLEDTAQLAQGRPLVAFVQVPLTALVGRLVERAARTYAGLGIDHVFLRVAGFDPQSASGAEVAAYRRALDALQDAGIPAVADCVGRFGLVTTAAGGAGFTCGARFNHWIAEDAVYEPSDMTSDPCRYEVPKRWFALDHADARRAAASHAIPSCPAAGCSALAAGAGATDLKEHLIHYFVWAVRNFAVVGAQGARTSLTTHPVGSVTQAWVSAL